MRSCVWVHHQFLLSLNVAILLMTNSLQLNSTNYQILANLPMIASISCSQKSFSNIYSHKGNTSMPTPVDSSNRRQTNPAAKLFSSCRVIDINCELTFVSDDVWYDWKVCWSFSRCIHGRGRLHFAQFLRFLRHLAGPLHRI